MDLAESSIEEVSWTRHAMRAAIVLAVVALVAAGAWALRHLSADGPQVKRQVARISILPDTPPPPPPPPREDKPPPPREEPKPMPQAETPKPAEAEKAAEAPIKMEGQAGDGPSAFAAGPVRNEYAGGAPSTGPAASATSALDRAQERLYANTARQLLRDAIERSFKSDTQQTTADFTVWLERDGAIRRFELVSTGNARLDGELEAALDDTRRTLRLPPPPGPMQPMRFRLSVRPQG